MATTCFCHDSCSMLQQGQEQQGGGGKEGARRCRRIKKGAAECAQAAPMVIVSRWCRVSTASAP